MMHSTDVNWQLQQHLWLNQYCKVRSGEELQLAVEEIFCWNNLPGLRCLAAERERKGQQTIFREVETPWAVVTIVLL